MNACLLVKIRQKKNHINPVFDIDIGITPASNTSAETVVINSDDDELPDIGNQFIAINAVLSGTANYNDREGESSSLGYDGGLEVEGEQENTDNSTASSRFKVRSLVPGSTFSHRDIIIREVENVLVSEQVFFTKS